MSETRTEKETTGIVSELRRRRVPETAIFYVAGAWALIEVAATLFPVFGFPAVAIKILLAALVIAFPCVLILSWTFDISLKGLVRTDATDNNQAKFDFADVPQRSIAVLPFVNMTGESDNDYFGDGLAEELLNLLAKRPDLKVAARTSSFAFRGKDIDIRSVGGLLGVHHVLEGSVRQAGKRMRITAQLIEAPSGYHLWSETFDRDVDDIFAIQDEISLAIADALQLAMEGKTQHERSADELPTESIEAYQYFLRANYLFQRRGADALAGSKAALSAAIELDPDYAEAYSRLAAAEAIMHEFNKESREEAFVNAESHARKAISLDQSLGEPHAVLGYMDLRLFRWESCELHLQRALALEESLPIPHQWYSNFLNDVGRHDDANREAMTAHAMDPLSPTANNILAFTALFRSDNKTAKKHSAIATKYGLGGVIPSYVDFVLALRNGEYEKATENWSQHLARSKVATDWLPAVVAAIQNPDLMGAAEAALDAARKQQKIDTHNEYFHYVLLGNERAFDAAQAQLQDHSLAHTWLMLPEAAALRETAGFATLMKEIGVMDYWRRHSFPDNLKFLEQKN